MTLVFDLFLVAVGIVWTAFGIGRYGFWADDVPGSGFVPVLVGCMIIILSLVDAFSWFRSSHCSSAAKGTVSEEHQDLFAWIPTQLRPLVPVAYAILGIIIFRYVGAVTACFSICLVWLLFVCKKPWVKAVLISLVVSAVVYGIFDLWLKIPFPNGLLF